MNLINDMNFGLRFILLTLFLLSFISGWFWLALGFFCWYLFRYTGFELVLICLLLDGYYGALSVSPVLSLGSFMLWSAMLFLRTRLMLYNQGNEIVF